MLIHTCANTTCALLILLLLICICKVARLFVSLYHFVPIYSARSITEVYSDEDRTPVETLVQSSFSYVCVYPLVYF